MNTAQPPKLIILLLVLLWLGGCTQIPTVKPKLPAVDADITRAAELTRNGDYLGAAALYTRVAQSLPAEASGLYWVSAAENFRAGGDLDGARAALAAAARSQLDPVRQLERRLLEAEILMDATRASDALALLLEPPPRGISTDLATRYHRDTARAFRLMGNLLESARELEALDALLSDPQARFDNQLEIVRTLAVLSEQALRGLQPSPPGVEGGWMELALVLKSASQDPSRLQPLLAEWQQRFPNHPALPGLLDGYFERQQSMVVRAAHVAVLLPESGTYAKVAAAIRDGLMAAWYSDQASVRPELRFYDSSNVNALWPIYSQAVAEGAELVVGPLAKDAVTQLARAGELPIPVLALNQIETESTPPDNLFQYSLSPEGEAQQVAEHAWVKGLRRPAILTQAGEWGDRIAAAFSERWVALGGEVAGHQSYDPESADHRESIEQLLLLSASKQRHWAMQKLLGARVGFEPRRRQDIDMIFLASKPKQTRLLRPQLQFHHANDLPVFATSHAWDGEVKERDAQDVAGVYLPDMPWLLTEHDASPLSRKQLQQILPAAGGPYGRLYAMGLDSYLLLPHLTRLKSSQIETLQGHTGNLYVGPVNHIKRQLVWARLDKTPEILGYSPRLDLERGVMAPGDAPPLAEPQG